VELIQNNASDGQTVKRLVALYRDNDLLTQAIDLLNGYLEVN